MEEKFTVSDFLRIIAIIHFAVVAGLLVFLLVSFLIVPDKSHLSSETDNMLLIIIAAVVFISFIASKVIYSNKIKSLRKRSNVSKKLEQFRAILIIRNVVIEASGFLAVIGFILTGKMIFAGFALLTVLYLLALWPSKQRIINDLQLNTSEEAFLDNPENEII